MFSIFQNKWRGSSASSESKGSAGLAPGLSRGLEPRSGHAHLQKSWAYQVTARLAELDGLWGGTGVGNVPSEVTFMLWFHAQCCHGCIHAQCGSDPLTSLMLQLEVDFLLFSLPLPRLTQHKAVNLSDIKLNRSQEFAQLSARPGGLAEEAWQPR